MMLQSNHIKEANGHWFTLYVNHQSKVRQTPLIALGQAAAGMTFVDKRWDAMQTAQFPSHHDLSITEP